MDKVNEIKQRLKDAGIRYWANDNISEVLQEGDKQALIEEALGLDFQDEALSNAQL